MEQNLYRDGVESLGLTFERPRQDLNQNPLLLSHSESEEQQKKLELQPSVLEGCLGICRSSVLRTDWSQEIVSQESWIQPSLRENETPAVLCIVGTMSTAWAKVMVADGVDSTMISNAPRGVQMETEWIFLYWFWRDRTLLVTSLSCQYQWYIRAQNLGVSRLRALTTRRNSNLMGTSQRPTGAEVTSNLDFWGRVSTWRTQARIFGSLRRGILSLPLRYLWASLLKGGRGSWLTWRPAYGGGEADPKAWIRG